MRVIQALGASRRWRVHVLALAGRLEAPVHLSRHTTSFHTLPPTASEADFIEIVAQTAQTTGARVILPLGEEAARACIRHRARLETIARLPPLPDLAAFDTAVDKASLALSLQQHGIPGPRTWVHAEGEPLPSELPGFGFPLIAKPSRGGFGVGIERANDAPGLRRILAGFGVGSRFIVQEYVPGVDVDCSVLAERGRILASTVQQAMVAPDREFAPATSLLFHEDKLVLALAEQLVRALAWSGLAHIDMRRDAATGEVMILEINARYWASVLGSVAAGVNFPDLACRAALGLPMPTASPRIARFTTQGLGFRPFLRHLRGQPSGFRFGETNLPFILRDPLPVLVEECAQRIKRLRSRLQCNGAA